MSKRDVWDLLAMFSVDTMSDGATDFAALVFSRLLPKWKGKPLGAVAADLWKQQKVSPKLFYCRMKRAVRPLLEADAETLLALGVPVPKERTTTAMAQAVALWMGFDG